MRKKLFFVIFCIISITSVAQTVNIIGVPQKNANVSPGFRNRVLYQFQIDVSGSATTLSAITGIRSTGTFQGSDLNLISNRGFRVHYFSNSGTPSYINNINSAGSVSIGSDIRATFNNNISGGQNINFNFTNPLNLSVGKHWLYITVDLASNPTLGRTIGLESFNQSVFQFSNGTIVNNVNFPASGLQNLKIANVSLEGVSPEASITERGIFHLQLYRVDVTATGAATQVGDATSGSPVFSFNVEGNYTAGTTDFNNFRAIYSIDKVLDQTDQQIGGSMPTGTTLTVNNLPITIEEGETRSIFLTTAVQSGATLGNNVKVSSVNMNLPSGAVFNVGKAPTNLSAGNLQTIGANAANVSIEATRPTNPSLFRGSSNAVLGRIKIGVTGATTLLSRLSAQIQGDFTSTDYSAIKLWGSDSEVFNSATAQLLNTWSAVQPNVQLQYNIPSISQISESVKYYPLFTPDNNRYFYYTADIPSTATLGKSMGLAVTASNLDANNTIISGVRTITLPTGATPTISASSSVAVSSFTTNANLIYQGAQNQVLYKMSISPSNSTDFTGISFLTQTSNFDIINEGYKLYISSNPNFDTATAQQLGTTVAATSNSQLLVFNSNPLNVIAGEVKYLFLIANIKNTASAGSTVDIAAPTLDNIKFSSAIASGNLTATKSTVELIPQITIAGSFLLNSSIGAASDNVVLYQTSITSSQAMAQINTINFKVRDSNISNNDVTFYKLFISDDNIFNPSTDLMIGVPITGSGASQQLAFSPTSILRLPLSSTRWFFLVADISGSALAGNLISIEQPSNANFSFVAGNITGNYATPPVRTITTASNINITSNTVAPRNVVQGAKDQVLYQVKLDITAASAKLLSAKFNLGVSTNNLTDVDGGYRLYSSIDQVLDNQDVLLATVSPVGTKVVDFKIDSPPVIAAGSSRTLFLVSSISSYAKVGVQIQVSALTSADLSFEGGIKSVSTNEGSLITVTAALPKSFPFPIDVATVLPCNTTLPSKVISITQSPFNADPTGVIDATSAFRAALAVNGSFVYIPNGTYRLTDSIMWNPTPRLVGNTAGRGGSNIVMWGESKEGVIIKLDNNAAGFNNPNTPKAMIFTGEASPDRFGNSIHNVTINTGSGNPGAIGLRHYCNNYGGVYNVNIVSGDGTGVIGMDKAYSRANGPSFMKGITIDGFNIGIRTDFAIESETFEHITLKNQKQIGFYNMRQILSIRDLRVENCAGPAFVNESGHVVLLDCDLNGAGPAAIRNDATAKLLARNINSTGYTQAILDPDKPISTQKIIEWTSNDPVTQYGSSGVPTTLNLPIKETPEVPWDDPSTWVNVETFGATPDGNCASPSACYPCDDDGPKIQAAIDATLPGGSREGATTLFLPADYRVMSTIRIRGSIRRLIGTSKGVQAPYAGINPGGMATPTNFIVEDGTSPVVIFENILAGSSTTNGCAGCLGVTHFENNSGRTLVFRNATMGSSTFTGGEVFFESVSGSRDGLFTFNNSRVWARQFNPERDAAKVIVDGGTFWALGLKTEGHGEIVIARNNAQVEIFGAYIYSLSDSRNEPMFDFRDAKVAINFFEYNGRWGTPYIDIVKEAQGGDLRILGRGAPATSYPTAAPIIPPTYPSNWSQRNDGSIGNELDGVVGTNLVLYSNNLVTYVAPDTEAPAIPTALSATAIQPTSFTLNWAPSTDNVGVTMYEIFRNGVSIGTTVSTTLNLSGLTPATVYSMTVIAKDAAGNVSNSSAALSVTTLPPDTQSPTVPTSLASSLVTHNSLRLSWTASTDNVGVTGYEIYRDDVMIGSSTTTTYNVTGLTAATTYAFKVVAKDAAGNTSAQSAAISVTTLSAPDTQSPTVPSALVSSNITVNSFTLSWTASTDNIGVVSYEVFRGGVSQGTSTATSMNITGLVGATTYSMTVVAKDAAGNVSAPSTALAVTTLTPPDTQAPTVPVGLASNSITQTSFTLSWTASTDNVGVASYEVFRDGVSVGTSTTTSMNITGLTASTTYSMRVTAKDAAGNVSAQSAALAVTTLNPPDTQAPTAPINLSSSTITQTSFTLSWTASTDNVGVVSYEVFRDGISIGTSTTTTMNVSNLAAGTAYKMTVKAKDAAGNTSVSSAELTVTTLAAPVSTVLKPNNLLTPNGDGQNDLWMIEGMAAGSRYQVKVFDSTGRQVYNSSNYSNDWDGTYKGQKLANGAYYYTITSEGKTIKGFLTILN